MENLMFTYLLLSYKNYMYIDSKVFSFMKIGFNKLVGIILDKISKKKERKNKLNFTFPLNNLKQCVDDFLLFQCLVCT